jgi:glutamate synthase (NADPH/NADH) small chain
VTQLEIMPTPPEHRTEGMPWPTYPMVYRVSSAHEEGGERLFSVNTTEFVKDADGRLAGMKIVEVKRGDKGFEPVEGTEQELPTQLVLLAMGFVGPEKGALLNDLEVDLDERGNVARDEQYMSSVDGVFVAGDMGRGQSLIVWAIAEGRSAAAGADRYLMGETKLPEPIEPTARPLM